jgi:hypothetical protein
LTSVGQIWLGLVRGGPAGGFAVMRGLPGGRAATAAKI